MDRSEILKLINSVTLSCFSLWISVTTKHQRYAVAGSMEDFFESIDGQHYR